MLFNEFLNNLQMQVIAFGGWIILMVQALIIAVFSIPPIVGGLFLVSKITNILHKKRIEKLFKKYDISNILKKYNLENIRL